MFEEVYHVEVTLDYISDSGVTSLQVRVEIFT